MSEHLIEFQGRNYSGRENQNLLWNENNIYIMDNHRAALWCWLKYLNNDEKYNFFHIDQHYDIGTEHFTDSELSPEDLLEINVNQYLTVEYFSQNSGQRFKVFGYGDYISVFFKYFPQKFNQVLFVTQQQGNISLRPKCFCEKELFDLIDNFDYWLSDDSKWIVNLDLDIFYQNINVNDEAESHETVKFLDDEFIISFAKELKKSYDKGKILVLTIALSPEFCGGWTNSENILRIFTMEFNLGFDLPAEH